MTTDPDNSMHTTTFLPRVKDLQHEAASQVPHVFMVWCLH